MPVDSLTVTRGDVRRLRRYMVGIFEVQIYLPSLFVGRWMGFARDVGISKQSDPPRLSSSIP